MIFAEAPQTVEEMKEIHRVIKGPTLSNMVEGGKTPLLSAPELEAIGTKSSSFQMP